MLFIKWLMDGFLAVTVVWLAHIYYHSAYCWTGHMKPSHHKNIHTQRCRFVNAIDWRRTSAEEPVHQSGRDPPNETETHRSFRKKWHSVTQKVWAIWLLLSVLCYSSASRLPSSVLSLLLLLDAAVLMVSQYAQAQEPGQRCHAYASFKQV